ncbi:CTP synthase [Oscillospiraceae bacterium OttesenSCG-928-G22]|nr:CTP synthase [Oscillospiraceae bacterium OttesenSCG-928-G22]
MPVKYIFVTGGVVSGLGKGITAASLGRLLKARGHRVTMQKLDPYLNVDPGTMSPYQHGEVFVTNDGAETDLDIGHYERFIDENLNVNSNVTSGKIYWSVLSRERAGDFLGGTVQVIPHITNEIKNRIYRMGKTGTDIVITEIGGTVGDIESQPYLEAIRQVAADVGRQNVLYIHVSLVVHIPGSNELKSKPTQHSVKELLSIGIQPDIIVCRTELPMTRELREKISLFCNIPIDCVIENRTAASLYEVPVSLMNEGLDAVVSRRLGLGDNPPDLDEWNEMLRRQRSPDRVTSIALVGKYVSMRDAYISVAEALHHGGIENDARVEIRWIDAENVTAETVAAELKGCDGILVPGGFGDRGIEGKIQAIRYARENGIPFFGICLGMQLAVVEIARAIGKMNAGSAEFEPLLDDLVIDLMPDQKDVTEMGGTMRLGQYPCILDHESKCYAIYGTDEIGERHRHRYELNNDYRDKLKGCGIRFAGQSPDGRLVEIIEYEPHPWFVGVQFHPELLSRPNRAHPLFRDFVRAACETSNRKV